MKKKLIRHLTDNFIISDENEFQSLNSKGFGIKSDNIFILNEYEAAYLLEKNKIEITNSKLKPVTKEEIISRKNFNLNKYIVFKDLQRKGYNVKTANKYGFDFRIYPKGKKEGEEHSIWLLDIINEEQKISMKYFSGKARIAHSTNKNVILAIIDDQKSINYIEFKWIRP